VTKDAYSLLCKERVCKIVILIVAEILSISDIIFGIERLRWSRGSVLAFSSNPAEAVGFLGRKNPQHAFLRRGSKAVGPMS